MPKKPDTSATDTRRKILQAAVKLFLSQGFAATSMSKIAESADVNQSLISHHFKNKEGLWLAVKEFVIEDIGDFEINQEPKSLKKFLEDIISVRLSLYAAHPDFKKLMAWQRMENIIDPQYSGAGTGKLATEYWVNPVKYLQAQGHITKKYPPELVFIWILKGMNGIIDDDLNYFKNNPHYTKIYTNMMIDGLVKALS